MSLTPQQQEAIVSTAGRLCVDAGAGSGKTMVLVQRIVYLIEKRGARLDDIVAITFTDAAASEMKARLRQEFRARAASGAESDVAWRDMAQRVDTARVSTIHTFCAALLRENALRIGLDPDFTVLADSESLLLREEVVTETLHALLRTRDEAALRAGAALGMRPLSETMRTMLNKRRLADLAGERHPLADPATLVGHWRELAEETARQSLIAFAAQPKLKQIRNQLAAFDGACSNAKDAREIGRKAMLTVLERMIESDDTNAIRASMEEAAALGFRNARSANWSDPETYATLKARQDEFRKLAKDALPPAIDEEVERRAAQVTCDVFATYERVRDAFQAAKTERAGMDFDDLIACTEQVLRDNESVRDRTARGIKFLLIDEFQDTDSAQLAIARTLSDHPGGPALFVVGDAKQSIYDFRGAEVEVFQAVKNDAEATIRLGDNFRSLPDVMQFVNEFFKQAGLLRAVEPHYAYLEANRAPVSQSRIEFLLPEPIDGAHAEDYRRAEADLIAGRLAEMCSGENRVQVYDKDADTFRPAVFGDAAILFRSTGAVYLYEEGLRRRNIPYNVIAGAGFYERQEVTDLRNLLKVIVDPWHEPALLGFLRSPMAGLSDETLMTLCRGKGLLTAFYSDTVPDPGPQPERLQTARALIDGLRAHKEMPLPAFLRHVGERTGCEALALSQFLGVQKACNVRKVAELAEDFCRTRPASLAAFVHYLDQVSVTGLREGEAVMLSAEAGAVTLMTIHKAKGLEFPIVVLPDASRGLQDRETLPIKLHRDLGLAARTTAADGQYAYPAIHSAIGAEDKRRGEDEHARILYVAMTRARDWLLISGSPDAKKGSWMHTFDTQWRVTEAKHGDTLAGNGWRGEIRRRPGTAAAPPQEPSAVALPEPGLLQARMGPVAPRTTSRTAFSVSELLDGMTQTPDIETDASTAAIGNAEALVRGNLVHRMFEIWTFEGEPDVNALLRAQGTAIKRRDEYRDYLAAVADRFLASPLGKRIADGTRVDREIPFTLRVGDAFVRGTIDALLEDGSIVDYKTGRHDPKRHARYETQLRLYAAATRNLCAQEAPGARLYYTDTGEQHEVDLSAALLDETMEQARRAIAALREAPPS
ncbi:MAG: UvrD-helicase domain-containing protein [Nitrospiraceae bacterium]|nr:UvrD-helicase domain-containing protein [Nitrospiraceae bacterium]